MKTTALRRMLLISLLTFGSLLVNAQEARPNVRELIAAIQAYGRCIDSQNTVSMISSQAALQAANAQCIQHINKIRTLDPGIAAKLDLHMKNRAVNRSVNSLPVRL